MVWGSFCVCYLYDFLGLFLWFCQYRWNNTGRRPLTTWWSANSEELQPRGVMYYRDRRITSLFFPRLCSSSWENNAITAYHISSVCRHDSAEGRIHIFLLNRVHHIFVQRDRTVWWLEVQNIPELIIISSITTGIERIPQCWTMKTTVLGLQPRESYLRTSLRKLSRASLLD